MLGSEHFFRWTSCEAESSDEDENDDFEIVEDSDDEVEASEVVNEPHNREKMQLTKTEVMEKSRSNNWDSNQTDWRFPQATLARKMIRKKKMCTKS